MRWSPRYRLTWTTVCAFSNASARSCNTPRTDCNEHATPISKLAAVASTRWVYSQAGCVAAFHRRPKVRCRTKRLGVSGQVTGVRSGSVARYGTGRSSDTVGFLPATVARRPAPCHPNADAASTRHHGVRGCTRWDNFSKIGPDWSLVTTQREFLGSGVRGTAMSPRSPAWKRRNLDTMSHVGLAAR